MTRFEYTPEETIAYDRGYAAGLIVSKNTPSIDTTTPRIGPCDTSESFSKAAAFGAIRRAAAVARECDRWELIAKEYGFEPDDLCHRAQAGRVREAIRAALKADA